MAYSNLFYLALLLVLSLNSVDCDSIIVETSHGKVAGKEIKSILPNEKYYSFYGIPYAEPPIGELRFMAPKPHSGWEHVLDCKNERSLCAQYYTPNHSGNHGFQGDEDCLTLSITTPILPKNEELNMPVIVFFMNEQFRFTSNLTKEYTPDFFMNEGVIVVIINHRLGSLGFLSFEDDYLPGNNALRDVILGLEWVQRNIRKFGGNPDKVTLMGSITGAALVDILLHVPKAKGLFHAAILQSGTSWSSLYFGGDGRRRAKELADAVEWGSATSKSLVKNLNRIDAEELTAAELRSVHTDEARKIQKGVPPFAPVIEHEHPDALITEIPDKSKLNIDVPIMIGYNSREALDLCERFLKKPQYLTFADRDFLMLFPVRTNFHFELNSDSYYTALQEIRDYYFDEGYVKISRPGEYITYIGDMLYIYPIDYTVRKYVNESRAPVYYYTFDYSGDFNMRKKGLLKESMSFDGTWGATLTDELCYLFVCRPIKSAYVKALKDPDSEEMKVLRNMIRLWSNFAKTGNPTPDDEGFKWTPATKENKECLLINDDLEMKTNLHEDRIKFWDEFIAKYDELAVDGVVNIVKDEL